LLAGDLAAGIVVEISHAAGAVAVVVEALAATHRFHHGGLSVFLDQRQEPRPVEARRVRVLESIQFALLPVADEVCEEGASPADAPFQEGEDKFGEAARDDAAEGA